MTPELLAHSGRPARGIGPQKYSEHIKKVKSLAEAKMHAALRYRTAPSPALASSVVCACEFHDLGKLEPENQTVLRTNQRSPLPINHVDAGVAHLASLKKVEAALAVYAHHAGLCDIPAEMAKDARARSDPTQAACRDARFKLATDRNLSHLLHLHHEATGTQAIPSASPSDCILSGLERRLLLSCLVDADHSDTACHYGQNAQASAPEPRWRERIAALDSYVEKLGGNSRERTEFRKQLYSACASVSPSCPIYYCDSPVGSGKTTAVMAYLLRAGAQLALRHIFVVLPYTNIIEQSVRVYRAALSLPGEDSEKVVAAHHHQAEFSSPDLRYLATLWDAPIIVTTAVQFFETLAANQTSRLRKLHQLPGSAVFVDEAHAAMPIHLWPYMWEQLMALARDWSCRFVLGSGSLAKFWENPRIMGEDQTQTVPTMVPKELHATGNMFERSRVVFRTEPKPLNLSALCDWVQGEAGPRLVVLNTVESAAVVATELCRRGVSTLHLSTALAPAHRKCILGLVRKRLDLGSALDWILVATSCVEAGLDFSFATAFRERCRVSSLVQIGGRVNRHGERGQGVVWDFVVSDPLLPLHPDFRHSREVVQDVFEKDLWCRDAATLMTYALEQEFKRQSGEIKIAELLQKERIGSYPAVATLSRLISADTRLVVVDSSLIDKILTRMPVPRQVLLDYSVQVWSSKISRLRLRCLDTRSELYAWDYDYDPSFTGIMAGVLKLKAIDREGCALV